MFRGRLGQKGENDLYATTSPKKPEHKLMHGSTSPVDNSTSPAAIREIGMSGALKLENPVTGDDKGLEGFVGR